MTKATTVTKAPSFYGVSAKDFLTLVQAETSNTRLGDMLAFVQKRIADHRAKHPSRVRRWERVSEAIVGRLNAGTVAPQLANAATFTTVSPKAKRTRKGKAVGFDLDGILAQSGMTAEQLMLQLASRVGA